VARGRRQFLTFLGAGLTGACAGGLGPLAAAAQAGRSAPFQPIRSTTQDDLVLPSGFRYDIITAAHDQAQRQAPDDAALVERLGHRVRVFMGAYDNIKVTTREDLTLVEALLEARGR